MIHDNETEVSVLQVFPVLLGMKDMKLSSYLIGTMVSSSLKTPVHEILTNPQLSVIRGTPVMVGAGFSKQRLLVFAYEISLVPKAFLTAIEK